MIAKFNKEEGLWYFDSPEYLASRGEDAKGDLLMVAGADVLLDIMSGFQDTITLRVELTPIEADNVVTCIRTNIDEGYTGATYEAVGEGFIDFKFWLCAVTLFVFGEYPQIMYFQKQ